MGYIYHASHPYTWTVLATCQSLPDHRTAGNSIVVDNKLQSYVGVATKDSLVIQWNLANGKEMNCAVSDIPIRIPT